MDYGCIGEKLSHSFSKEIHACLADYDYQLCEIPRNELTEFMRARAFKAINVTIPYKQDVLPFLDEIDPIAAEIGAVNTIVNRGGKLYGYNTDFAGMTALMHRANIDPSEKKVLILGSGGTSKTAAAVVRALGARKIIRVSRTAKDGCVSYEQVYAEHTDAEILINTTPCGMYPEIDAQPLDVADFPQLIGVVDAIYNPLRSQLIRQAISLGISATGGLYMLVAQAAVAVGHFLGTPIDEATIDQVYRSILNRKQNLVLVGMPGSGKSTLGKRFAEKHAMPFIDTDDLIREQTGTDISTIFAERGEAAFRDIEAAVIRQIESVQHTVIATGGGAILREENICSLTANGRICFLDRPLSDIVATADRPLSSDRERLQERYNERYALYCAAADYTVNCVADIPQNIQRMEEGFMK